MEKEFIPYEIALNFKELGFDEPCFGYYLASNKEHLLTDSVFYTNSELRNDGTTSPIFSQIFDWLDEKYNLDISINKDVWGSKRYNWRITGGNDLICSGISLYDYDSKKEFDNKIEAKISALNTLIKEKIIW